METVKLHIEVQESQLGLIKSFLQNIKGILKVEEDRDELAEELLQIRENVLSGKMKTFSEEEFKTKIDQRICELYSQNGQNKVSTI